MTVDSGALAAQFVEVDDRDSAELLAAFWSYEKALLDHDLPTLDGWLVDAPATICCDGADSDQIGAFHRAHPTPARRIDRLHLRPAGQGAVLVLAETVRADGGLGAHSQLWVRRPAGWRLSAMQTSSTEPRTRPAVAPDTTDQSIWRRVEPSGKPLVAGVPGGPLAGTRVAVKDLFAIAGERIGAGNPTRLAEARPETDTAVAVRALLDAGADVTGIAQTDEFAFSLAGANIHYGTPENAAAPGCVTGGSSSGPAAAVAAGQADLGLGTDTAGSIRVPASYCGLYGIRPTHGAVSSAGVQPLAPSFDTPGLLSRDPELLRRAADALLPEQHAPAVRELLIGLDLLDRLDEPMRLAFVAAVRAFAGRTGLPMRIVPAACGGRQHEWYVAFRTVQGAQAWAAHGDWLTAHPGNLDAPIEARFRSGGEVSAARLTACEQVLAGARKELHALIEPGTALVLPAATSAAPRRGLPAEVVDKIRSATLHLTCLASLAGLPAVVAPSLRLGNRPAGLCLIGAPDSDRALLDLLD